MKKIVFSCLLLLSGILASGCARENAPVTPGKEAEQDAAAKEKFLLGKEPSGAKGVIEMKQEAKEGDEVVVVGRIGGSEKPFTGRASFTIVDPSLKPCNEKDDDACPCPWDYCCDTPEDLAKATVLVKFVDDKGKTLPDDAKTLLGVKELQTVIVRGQAKRDADSITVVASGLFIKK